MRSAVAFLIFNRPKHTRRVFEEIRRARPGKLLIVADGPRDDRERAVCEETRAIVNEIDWRCEVLTNYSEANLGCKNRVASGLDWVFEQVEEAIVLEDDCLPDPTFFRFCDELLERYRDDDRVVHVSGNNFQFGKLRPNASYYFSAVNHIWGWASWRRAWKSFDVTIRDWPCVREGDLLSGLWGDTSIARGFRDSFDRVRAGTLDTWDSQWTLACWLANGLSILPTVNLVSNIGFGDGATHTRSPRSICANLPTTAMQFPLVHPHEIVRDRNADIETLERLANSKNL